MPASKTALQLLNAVRQNTTTVNSGIVTDAEVYARIDEGVVSLQDEIISVYEHFFVQPFAFTIGSGNTVTLPLDFYKDNGLDYNPGPQALTVHRLESFLARNNRSRRGYMITGQTLTIYPAPNAAGSYLLYYTPNASVFDPDFAVRVTIAAPLPSYAQSGTGPSKTLTASSNGALPALDGVSMALADLVLVTGAAPAIEWGIYTIASLGSAGSKWVMVRATNYDESLPTEIRLGAVIRATEGTVNINVPYALSTFAGSVDVSTQTYSVATLPQAIAPFYEYIELYATLAVFAKRQMDPSDFPTRFAMAKARVQKMAANRTEEPGQVPLTRGFSGSTGWWNEDLPT